MSKYTAKVIWSLPQGENFLDNTYSRGHRWQFDGGIEVMASSSPQVVPIPYSVSEYVDPEEAFVASVSSCHMLWFLTLASKAGLEISAYHDHAQGVMAKNQAGKLAMTEITLFPEVKFADHTTPSQQQLDALHEKAHSQCFIANSIHTEVRVVSTLT